MEKKSTNRSLGASMRNATTKEKVWDVIGKPVNKAVEVADRFIMDRESTGKKTSRMKNGGEDSDYYSKEQRTKYDKNQDDYRDLSVSILKRESERAKKP